MLRKFLLMRLKRRLVFEYCTYLDMAFPEWKKLRTHILKKLLVWYSTHLQYRWVEGGHKSYFIGWKRRIILTHSEWMKGCDSIIRALRSFCWDRSDGSGKFYWRWPDWYKICIRDGIPFHFRRPPPQYMTPQRGIQDGRRMKVVVDKLNKVLDRRYLGGGSVKSLTAFLMCLRRIQMCVWCTMVQ